MDSRLFLKRLVSVIFPPLCVSCRKRIEEGALCGDCERSIEIRSGFTCPECGRRIPACAGGPTRTNPLEIGNPCHEKAKFVLAAATFYEISAVRELIHALKYQRIKTALRPISEIVGKYVEKTIGDSKSGIQNFIIVPVPLYLKKERERGFNQATLIAGLLNKNLGIDILENNLVRKRKTNSQTKTKNYEEREKNVADCFEVKCPELIAGKNVILVDDVFTSGATMREAVRVLKNAGARKIIGFVVAKT
ncbi:MAG: ComF family protein [Candidatus Jorgensenbacteria bacterium]